MPTPQDKNDVRRLTRDILVSTIGLAWGSALLSARCALGISMICPKCRYERQATDMAPDYECPKCGIVYAKYNALRQPAPAAAAPAPKPPKATATKNLKAMFAKIENREGAIKVAKENGILFMVVAGIQGVLGFFIAKVLLLDAAAFATCGLFIYYKHSRVAAVIALLLSAAALASTIMNITGHKVGGGNNIFLAVIVVAGGVRAVEATFKLAGRFKERATRGVQKPTPPSTAIVAVGSTPVDNSAGTPPA